MAIADTANLVVRLSLDDKISSKLKGISSSLKGMQGGLGQVGKGVGQVAGGLTTLATRVGILAGVGFVAVTKAAGDFEAQLNTINTIAGKSGPELAKIGDGIRETFRDTGQPLEDLTAAYYDLLSAGVDVADAQGLLNASVTLGIGGLGTTSESVDLLTTAMNSYGLTLDETVAASDVFAAAVRDGKVTISEIASEFSVVAPLASSMGISIEEIGATLATMTAAGTPAGEALTSMRSAMVALQRTTPALDAVLADLGITNVQAYADANGLAETWALLDKRGKELGYNTIELTGRIEGTQFVLGTSGANAAAYTTELTAMGDATGEAARQASEREQGLNYQLGRLSAGFHDAAITIGTELLPVLVPMIEELNDFLGKPETQKGIREFATNLGEGLRDFIEQVRSTDFSTFISTMKGAADVAKGAFDAFRSLPPEVQSFALAALIANKASGGAVGQIAGGLVNIVSGAAKALVGGLFLKGGSPANPLWVAMAGPGGLAGGVGAAGGLKISSLLGVVSAIGLGALIGNEIGHALFFDPTVKPATDFETERFTATAGTNNLSDLTHNIEAIQGGIDDINALGPLGFLAGDQKALLESQLAELKARLPEVARYALETSTSTARMAERDAERNVLIGRQLSAQATANMKLQQIAVKPNSVHVTTNVTSYFSLNDAVTKMTTLLDIRQAYGGGSL